MRCERLKQQVVHLASMSDDLTELRIDPAPPHVDFGLSHSSIQGGLDAAEFVGIHVHII